MLHVDAQVGNRRVEPARGAEQTHTSAMGRLGSMAPRLASGSCDRRDHQASTEGRSRTDTWVTTCSVEANVDGYDVAIAVVSNVALEETWVPLSVMP
jgi:hypothetical protein